MRTVTSRQNPLVRACRALADGPATADRVLLDGTHLVREAMSAGLQMEIVLVAISKIDSHGASHGAGHSAGHSAGFRSEEGALAHELDRAHVDVVAVSDTVLAAASPVRTPSGILAIATRRHIPAARDVFCDPRALIVVAVDVQDPGNVGALIRVAEAGGATGACICGASAHPFSWRALRGGMGSTLRLPTVSGLSAHGALDAMIDAGLQTVAAVAHDGEDPDAIDWRGRTALLLGGEGQGLSADLVARCQARVTIPMAAAVESLNVAAAGAILVYAARRQRTPQRPPQRLPERLPRRLPQHSPERT